MDLFEYAKEKAMEEESPLASRLRPSTLEEVVGQTHIVGKDKLLYRAIKADKLSSIIFYGPPGTGKTTLAKVIANTTSANFTQINATVAGKKDMEAVTKQAQNDRGMFGKKTILFIDEIHRMPMAVEEVLYSAMEDYYIDIMIGAGETSRSVHLDLPPFTLVGATTRAGMLSNPLRARFGINGHMEYYELPDLTEIVERTSEIFEMTITPEAALELARRSRGTPRIANRLLKRVRDYAQIMGDGVIDDKIADQALTMLDVDHEGLDYVDQKILRTMIEMYGGGPVGLGTLSVNIAEERETVEDMYEPYLIQKGFIMRTRTGRVATAKAYEHMGYDYTRDN